MSQFVQLFSLVIAVLFTQVSFSQEPHYQWGEPATNDFPERRVDKLLALDNDGFALLRRYTNSTFTTYYWLEYYSPELSLEGSVPVEFNGGVMGNSSDIEDVFVANGIVYAIISSWKKDAGKNTLSISELSLSGELNHLKELDIIPAKKMLNRGQFSWSISPDKQKILVLSEQPYEKKTNEKLRLTCFELPSMNFLWMHDQELSLTASKALHNEVVVDDEGRAFLFKKDYNKTWAYHLYSYSPETKWQSYPVVGMEEFTVLDHQLGVGQNDEFYLFATYTKQPSAFKKQLNGSWFVALNGALGIKTQITSPWRADVLAHFGNKKMAEAPSEKGRLDDFYIKDILTKSDGDLLVLMEQLKAEEDMIAGTSPIQYTYSWNYGQFLVFNINPANGQHEWWQSFEKSQRLTSSFAVEEFGSFLYHLKEDRLYVLWNNTQLSIPGIPPAGWTEPDGTRYVKRHVFDEKTSHGTFMHVIEPDGTMAYGNRKHGLPLLNLHKGAVFEMSLTTPFSFSLHGNLVVMSAMHNGGKRYRFGIIGL